MKIIGTLAEKCKIRILNKKVGKFPKIPCFMVGKFPKTPLFVVGKFPKIPLFMVGKFLKLDEWLNSNLGLLMYGPRQVGKTYIINKYINEHFESHCYINLYNNVDAITLKMDMYFTMKIL